MEYKNFKRQIVALNERTSSFEEKQRSDPLAKESLAKFGKNI